MGDSAHGGLKELMNIKKFLLALFITVLAFCSVAGGVTIANFLYGDSLSGSITRLLDKPVGDKVNILVMGLDQGKTRADTIMIVTINPKDNTVKLLSVPRDTRVHVGRSTIKINSTMAYERREELMIQKLREITGMPIHYYAEIDFNGFKEVIDILGGVDYNVPYHMNYDDPTQNLHIHLSPGMQHLDGQAAHDYVRFRQNNDGSLPGNYVLGDPGRIEAQQAFIKELVRQKLQPKYLLKASKLAKEISEHVTTNFTVAEGLKYVGMLRKMEPENFKTFVLPGGSQMVGGASYYLYDAVKTKELVLQEFGYPEEAKKQESTSTAK